MAWLRMILLIRSISSSSAATRLVSASSTAGIALPTTGLLASGMILPSFLRGTVGQDEERLRVRGRDVIADHDPHQALVRLEADRAARIGLRTDQKLEVGAHR